MKAILVALAACAAAAGPALAAAPATSEGLRAEASSRIDELRVGNLALLGSQVLIAPVQVRFHRDWLDDMARARGPAYRVSPADADRIAGEMASSLRDALGEELRGRGFQVVSAPANGVVILQPSVDDLYVNAPELATSQPVKAYVREAGRATLRLEARDAASGSPVLVAVHRSRAGETASFQDASAVSNRFWFEALFRRWAADVVGEVKARAGR